MRLQPPSASPDDFSTGPSVSRPLRILAAALGIAAFLLASPSTASAQETALTLQETLANAQAALAAGDYAGANRTFEALETTFAREPEVQQASFRLIVLPLHAYAALLAGESEKAIARFNTFLKEFPEDRSRLPFVLYNLARAHQELGDAAKAIDAYRSFVALDPDRPEAALATLAAADLMFEDNRAEEAFGTLTALIERNPPAIIRNKARLTALQQALALNRIDEAAEMLLSQPWAVADMPELAVLAFAALEMGQHLLATQRYADAITCYRLIPPYAALLEAQSRRLSETRARFETRRSDVGIYQGGQFWTQFYSRLIARLEQQLTALQGAEDYTPALYLAMGQAYLLDGRAHEAWILFETLARDENLGPAQQSEAHYRWILSAIEVGVWEDAFRIAKGFGERFPESPLVPDALFLLATAYQEARQYRDAVEVLTVFLANHGDHGLAPRARFLRGYNYNLLNQPVEARADFEQFIARHPKNGLLLDARFWRALTYFAEFDYAATLDALDALVPEARGHRLEPEIAYRRATVFYAQENFEEALRTINAFLTSYPNDPRIGEARVLLGDIQMGRGELTAARTIFAAIEPSDGHLFTYAAFQVGKILRAVAGAEDRADTRDGLLEAHRRHFENYVARDDIPVALKERVSEALYWIGWTYIEQGTPEMARAIFADALEVYGDDIEAVQVPNIIDAYARTTKRIDGLGRAARDAALREWIDQQKAAALASDRLTYYARLNFYLEDMRLTEEGDRHPFEIVERVPIERIDPEGLGRLAATLVNNYPTIAVDFLEFLENEYPDNRHISYAYFTRAVLLRKEQRYEAAAAELERFRAGSPQHPLSQRATLLYADTLTRNARYEEATEVLEGLLRLRQAKGRPHAEALLALSRNAETAGLVERAIPYAQRVYNVYRAYPDLAAEAYWMSAQQFERIGDPLAAYRTLDEMLGDARIRALPIANQAAAKRDELMARLPAGALDGPGETAPLPTPSEGGAS
ncbi:MAG: tol-pal system YbgF family protein [Puniceicoccaceae bacterium]